MRLLYWLPLPILTAVLALVPSADAECGIICHTPVVVGTPSVVVVPGITTILQTIPVPYAFLQYVAVPTLVAPVAIAQPAQGVQGIAGQAVAGQTAPLAGAAPPLAPAVPAPALAAAANDSEARLARIEAALERLSLPRTADQVERTVDGPPLIRRANPSTRPTPRASGSVDTVRVASLLQTRCAQCHTSPGRGDMDLFDARGQFVAGVDRDEIYRAVRSGKMPKSPNKLAPEEVAMVKQWASEKR